MYCLFLLNLVSYTILILLFPTLLNFMAPFTIIRRISGNGMLLDRFLQQAKERENSKSKERWYTHTHTHSHRSVLWWNGCKCFLTMKRSYQREKFQNEHDDKTHTHSTRRNQNNIQFGENESKQHSFRSFFHSLLASVSSGAMQTKPLAFSLMCLSILHTMQIFYLPFRPIELSILVLL